MRRWYGGSDRLINEGHYEGLQMPRPLVPNRRGRLLAAARELFHEQGWPRTTVADIAARAGVGKGAVYLEFADKARVLDALIRDSTRQLVDQVRQRVQSADGLVGLAQVYRFGVEELLGDPLMCALYLGDADLLGAHMAQMPEERYRERVGWLDEYARGLQHAGVISEGIEPDHIVRMLSTFTIGLVRAPGLMGPTTGADLSASVALFADVVGRGLAADRIPDADAAREAQLLLLRRLDDQLAALDAGT